MNKALEVLKTTYKPYRYTKKKNITIIDSTSGSYVIKEKKDNKYIRNKYPWKTQSDYEEPTYDLEEYARRSIHLKYEKKSDRQ